MTSMGDDIANEISNSLGSEKPEAVQLIQFLRKQLDRDQAVMYAPDFVVEHGARGEGWGNRGACPLCGGHQWSGTEVSTEIHWEDHAEGTHQKSKVLADIQAKRFLLIEAERALRLAAYMSNVPLIAFYQRIMIKMSQVYKDEPDFKQEWLR